MNIIGPLKAMSLYLSSVGANQRSAAWSTYTVQIHTSQPSAKKHLCADAGFTPPALHYVPRFGCGGAAVKQP